MIQKLEKRNADDKDMRIIKTMYWNQRAEIGVINGISEYTDTKYEV